MDRKSRKLSLLLPTACCFSVILGMGPVSIGAVNISAISFHNAMDLFKGLKHFFLIVSPAYNKQHINGC